MKKIFMAFVLTLCTTTSITQGHAAYIDSKIAACHQPEQGPPGPQGPQGPTGPAGVTGATGATGASFITTLGTWFIPNPVEETIDVDDGNPIPFVTAGTQEVAIGITPNSVGPNTDTFTVTQTGVYQVTFGLAYGFSGGGSLFDLSLNGVPVSGGNLVLSTTNIMQTLTVMVSATAGDTLSVVNNGGGTVSIGYNFDSGGSNIAYISILQVN